MIEQPFRTEIPATGHYEPAGGITGRGQPLGISGVSADDLAQKGDDPA